MITPFVMKMVRYEHRNLGKPAFSLRLYCAYLYPYVASSSVVFVLFCFHFVLIFIK